MHFTNTNNKYLVSVCPMLGTAITDLRASSYCTAAVDLGSGNQYLSYTVTVLLPGGRDGGETIKQLEYGPV